MSARNLKILKKGKTEEPGTRERILAAAAPLFAENGFEATGVRAIAAKADVNIAAVNYHFGSKDALVAAVGEYHVRQVNERRLTALEAVLKAAPGGKPTVEAVVDAFIAPSVRFTVEDPSNFQLMRLILTRIKTDSEQTGRLIREAMVPTLNKFVDALALASPATPRAMLHRALHLAVGALLHAMTCTEILVMVTPGVPDDPEAVIGRLVRFTSAGVGALTVK